MITQMLNILCILGLAIAITLGIGILMLLILCIVSVFKEFTKKK